MTAGIGSRPHSETMTWLSRRKWMDPHSGSKGGEGTAVYNKKLCFLSIYLKENSSRGVGGTTINEGLHEGLDNCDCLKL